MYLRCVTANKLTGLARILLVITLSLGITTVLHCKEQPQDFDALLLAIEIEKTSNQKATQEKIAILKDNYQYLNDDQKELYQFFAAHSLALNGSLGDSINKLEDLIQHSKNTTLITRVHALLSNVYLFKGEYEQAYLNAATAIKNLAGMEAQSWHKYATLHNLTSLFRQSGMTNTAIDYARQMLKEVEQYKQPLQLCGSYFELADLELSMKNVELAWSHGQEAINYCKKAKDPIYYTMALNLEAKLLLQADKREQALYLLEKHYPKVKEIDYKTLTTVFELQLAETYLEVKDFDKAFAVAIIAYNRAQQMNDKVRLMLLSKVIATYYSETGQLKESLKYYRQYIEMEKEIEILTNKRKVAYYMVSQRH